MTDHDLAALGDAFINFVHSLALSNKTGRAAGSKVKGTLLAEALRRAELRKHMPSRMTTHKLADAAEALLVYAWLQGCVTIEESVATLEENSDSIEGLTLLLKKVKSRVKLS
jgi:hypothetical protein